MSQKTSIFAVGVSLPILNELLVTCAVCNLFYICCMIL